LAGDPVSQRLTQLVGDFVRDEVDPGTARPPRVEVNWETCKVEGCCDEAGPRAEDYCGVTDSIQRLRDLSKSILNISKKIRVVEEKMEREDELNEKARDYLDSLREEYEKLRGEHERVLEEVRSACRRCSCGGSLVYGEYVPGSHLIILYPSCLLAEECVDKYYYGRVLLETLAHELIHAGQYEGWRSIDGVRVEVRMDPGRARLYASLPYRYRPHEVEAFDKMARVAGALRRRDSIYSLLVEEVAARLIREAGLQAP